MIEVKNLTKNYGSHKAVNNISFTINDGEIVGFLGPNGAGKSTTMNIITGYISSTEGTVTVNGYDILEEPEKAKGEVGYLPELPPLYMDMYVEEYLNFVADLKHVKKQDKAKIVASVMETTKITHMKSRLIKQLSKGYKQRVGLSQALIGNPDVLVLDEPTVGLDPKQIIEIRDVIKDLGKKHTIILSSHILSEISAICDRVIIINKGKIVASDSPENLSKKLSESNRLMIRIKGEEAEVLETVKSVENVKEVTLKGSVEAGTVDIIVEAIEGMDVREAIVKSLAEKGMFVLNMNTMNLSLEEIFLQVTQGNGGKN